MKDKRKIISWLQAQPKDADYPPSLIADELGINSNTLRTDLSTFGDSIFAATRTEENGYRYYDKDVVKRICLFRALNAGPFRVRKRDIESILRSANVDVLWKLYARSNGDLQKHLIDNGMIS